jgi:hypothetical protein
MFKFGSTILITMYIAIYLIFGNFMGRFAVPGTLLVAAYITFLITRRSWEVKEVIEGLPEEQRNTFYNNVGQIMFSIEKLKDLRLIVGDEALVDRAYIAAIEALSGGLNEEDEKYILKLFWDTGRNPLDKQLARTLNGKLHLKYVEHYKEFRTRRYGRFTTCISFPRMYKLVMTTAYRKALDDSGLSLGHGS